MSKTMIFLIIIKKINCMTAAHLTKKVGAIFKGMLPPEVHFINLLKTHYQVPW